MQKHLKFKDGFLEVILSAHQPAYLPWLGYLERISLSDKFVILDQVQFEKNSFINRNKIKTKEDALWLTIPVNLKKYENISTKQNSGKQYNKITVRLLFLIFTKIFLKKLIKKNGKL